MENKRSFSILVAFILILLIIIPVSSQQENGSFPLLSDQGETSSVLLKTFSSTCLSVSFSSNIILSTKITDVYPVEVASTFFSIDKAFSSCLEERGFSEIDLSKDEIPVLYIDIPMPSINLDVTQFLYNYQRKLRISFSYDPLNDQYWLNKVFIMGVFGSNLLEYYQMASQGPPPIPASYGSSSHCNNSIWTASFGVHQANVVLRNLQFSLYIKTESNFGDDVTEVCPKQNATTFDEEELNTNQEIASGFTFVSICLIIVGIGAVVLILALIFVLIYHLHFYGNGHLGKPNVNSLSTSESGLYVTKT